MHKKRAFLILAFFEVSLHCGSMAAANSYTLREEVNKQASNNHTCMLKDAYPQCYAMINNLCGKLTITAPHTIWIRRITTEQYVTPPNSFGYSRIQSISVNNVGCGVDIFGDIDISYEILKEASDRELEGIFAMALAEKATMKKLKLICIAAASFAATVILAGLLQQYFKFDLIPLVPSGRYGGGLQLNPKWVTLMLLPSALTLKAYLDIDSSITRKAKSITDDNGSVGSGLTAISTIRKNYATPSCWFGWF